MGVTFIRSRSCRRCPLREAARCWPGSPTMAASRIASGERQKLQAVSRARSIGAPQPEQRTCATVAFSYDASGRVVFSTVARVGNNIETIDQMLSLAMPEARISANTMNGFVLLTGTVQSPDDAAEAEMLVQAFVGEGTKVLSRLRSGYSIGY